MVGRHPGPQKISSWPGCQNGPGLRVSGLRGFKEGVLKTLKRIPVGGSTANLTRPSMPGSAVSWSSNIFKWVLQNPGSSHRRLEQAAFQTLAKVLLLQRAELSIRSLSVALLGNRIPVTASLDNKTNLPSIGLSWRSSSGLVTYKAGCFQEPYRTDQCLVTLQRKRSHGCHLLLVSLCPSIPEAGLWNARILSLCLSYT